jgi:hypothetical protein
VVNVIVWWLDLQLSVQSVPIATKIEFEPRSCRGVLDTTLCDKVCQRLATGPLITYTRVLRFEVSLYVSRFVKFTIDFLDFGISK